MLMAAAGAPRIDCPVPLGTAWATYLTLIPPIHFWSEDTVETLISMAGIVGAILCVATYAAATFGRISADGAFFFFVQAAGAALILFGASREFDIGDLGSIGQEAIWALLSIIGGTRALMRQTP
jgi:hypothetical protein